MLSRRDKGESEAIGARVRRPRVIAVDDVLPRCGGGGIAGDAPLRLRQLLQVPVRLHAHPLLEVDEERAPASEDLRERVGCHAAGSVDERVYRSASRQGDDG